MPFYESVLIARQDISTPQVDSLTEELTKVIEDQSGKVVKMEYWGLRSLAYKIRKNRKGHFILFGIDGPSSVTMELERRMRLNEDVLRYLTVKVDAIDDGPSVMMQRGPGRDDRPGRDGGHQRHERAAPPQRTEPAMDAVTPKPDTDEDVVAPIADASVVTGADTSTDANANKDTDGGEK